MLKINEKNLINIFFLRRFVFIRECEINEKLLIYMMITIYVIFYDDYDKKILQFN